MTITTAQLSPEQLRSISRKLERLRFLRQPPHLRQQTRARVQQTVNAEIAREQRQPSALARLLADGGYDEPRPGELEELERWARGE